MVQRITVRLVCPPLIFISTNQSRLPPLHKIFGVLFSHQISRYAYRIRNPIVIRATYLSVFSIMCARVCYVRTSIILHYFHLHHSSRDVCLHPAMRRTTHKGWWLTSLSMHKRNPFQNEVLCFPFYMYPYTVGKKSFLITYVLEWNRYILDEVFHLLRRTIRFS